MARMARLKLTGTAAWYHVHCRTAGHKGSYPLMNVLCQRKMTALLKFLSGVYCCEIAAFCVMGNHYHLIIKFNRARRLDKAELFRRALLLYPKSEKYLRLWREKKWDQFNKRIYDLSEYMRNFQALFARWYNKTYERRGRFWGDRFKSVLLEDYRAVMDCMLYVDLNPVRAGLVTRPEEWRYSSIYYRMAGLDGWLIALRELLSEEYAHKKASEEEVLTDYRQRLYYRGNIATQDMELFEEDGKELRPKKELISDEILASEKSRGFKVRGMYGRQLRYFADGIALGGEGFIRQIIQRLRDDGRYIRRQHPIDQVVDTHKTVREQRSHAVVF
jgi:putative transposase